MPRELLNKTNKQTNGKWDLFISIQFKLDVRQVFDLTLNSFFYCFSAEPVGKNIDEGIFQAFSPFNLKGLIPATPPPEVNFTNIFWAPFLYESVLRSFYVWLCNFFDERKSAQKLLVKCWWHSHQEVNITKPLFTQMCQSTVFGVNGVTKLCLNIQVPNFMPEVSNMQPANSDCVARECIKFQSYFGKYCRWLELLCLCGPLSLNFL